MSIIKGRMDALKRREEVMAALRSALHDVVLVYAEGAHDPLMFLTEAQRHCRTAESLIEGLKRVAEGLLPH